MCSKRQTETLNGNCDVNIVLPMVSSTQGRCVWRQLDNVFTWNRVNMRDTVDLYWHSSTDYAKLQLKAAVRGNSGECCHIIINILYILRYIWPSMSSLWCFCDTLVPALSKRDKSQTSKVFYPFNYFYVPIRILCYVLNILNYFVDFLSKENSTPKVKWGVFV